MSNEIEITFLYNFLCGPLAKQPSSWPSVIYVFFWFKRVLDWGPEQIESKLTVLSPLIIIVLISYIIIYNIVIKLLIMENHPSQNRKQKELQVIFVYFWSRSTLLCKCLTREY